MPLLQSEINDKIITNSWVFGVDNIIDEIANCEFTECDFSTVQKIIFAVNSKFIRCKFNTFIVCSSGNEFENCTGNFTI